MTRTELAQARFRSGFNCTQAVLSAFSEDLELEAASAAALCECFGGRVCNGGMPCGALLGASMALGLYAGRRTPDDGDAKTRTEQLRKRLYESFAYRCGSVYCRDLLEGDITTPEGFNAARETGVLARCDAYVAAAADALEEILLSGE